LKEPPLSAGQAFIEVIDAAHNGKNLGGEPVKILVFFSGERDQRYTVRSAKK
jgi:quercetin dioxygenase-like cupin family protein